MVNKILQLIPVIQSAELAERNLKRFKKKKKTTKDFIEQGTENILATAFISETSNFLS